MQLRGASGVARDSRDERKTPARSCGIRVGKGSLRITGFSSVYFYQVKPVAIQIFEDNVGAIGHLSRLSVETNAAGG